LPLASSTASGALNYYQQDDTTLASVTWGFSTPTSAFAVKITRVGRVVTLLFPQKYDGTSTAVGSVSLSVNLPTFARPSIVVTVPVFVVSNNIGVATPGAINITTAGVVQLYFSNGTALWPALSNSGLYSAAISFSV
jgi:hypothetical protein